jgi:hypothetical protein
MRTDTAVAFLNGDIDENETSAIFTGLLKNAVISRANEFAQLYMFLNDSEQDDAVTEIQQIRPHVVDQVERSVITALQEWEGYVLTVYDGIFSARLLDLTANAKIEQEIAEFNVSDISRDDFQLLQEGAVFRWIIGNQITRGGQKRRVSQIIFRRLPAWTKREIEDARREASETSKAIKWE